MKGRWWIVGYLIAVATALLSPLASGSPDGLERVAEDHGFISKAKDVVYSIIPDYAMPGIGNEALATMIAGVIGVTMMFALLYGLTWAMLRFSSGRKGMAR